jgi:hypothetical protein
MSCVGESLLRLNQSLEILMSKREYLVSLANNSEFNTAVGNVVLLVDNLSNSVNYKFSRIVTKTGKDVIYPFPSLCNAINSLTTVISDSYVTLNNNSINTTEVEKTLSVVKKVEKLITAYTELYAIIDKDPCKVKSKVDELISVLNTLNEKLKKCNTYVFYVI